MRLYLLLIFTAVLCPLNLFAFEQGELVYIKYNKQNWISAKYLKSTEDCVLVESKKNSDVYQLVSVDEIIETEIELNNTVHLHKEKKLKLEFQHTVKATNIYCHHVNKLGDVWNGNYYVKQDEILSSNIFEEKIGNFGEKHIGEVFYAKTRNVSPEMWAKFKLIAKQDKCLKTDNLYILSELDVIFTRIFLSPLPFKKIPKNGANISINPSYNREIWIQVKLKIKSKSKSHLIILIPVVDEPNSYFEEKVLIKDIYQPAIPLSEDQFKNLKNGDKLTFFTDPQSCDYSYLKPITITSDFSECYILSNIESTDQYDGTAYYAEDLIAATAIEK